LIAFNSRSFSRFDLRHHSLLPFLQDNPVLKKNLEVISLDRGLGLSEKILNLFIGFTSILYSMSEQPKDRSKKFPFMEVLEFSLRNVFTSCSITSLTLTFKWYLHVTPRGPGLMTLFHENSLILWLAGALAFLSNIFPLNAIDCEPRLINVANTSLLE